MDDDRQVHIQYKGVSAVLLKHLIFVRVRLVAVKYMYVYTNFYNMSFNYFEK